MALAPYVFLEGRAEEAIAFYRQALGAEVMAMMRVRESPDPYPPGMLPPGSEEKVMHAELRIGGATLMLSDGRCSGRADIRGVALSLTMPDAAAATRVFEALAAEGQVQMPLGATFFSPCFGMASDRFGVNWMVHVAR